MCQTSTMQDISIQKADKAVLRLSERFISPVELLRRYRDFYANAGSIIKSCIVSDSTDQVTKTFFNEKKKEFDDALLKLDSPFRYDPDKKTLIVRWSASPYKYSVDHETYILDMGEDGSAIGIELFNVVL